MRRGGASGGWLGLAFGADDAAGDANPFGKDKIEAFAILVRPDRAHFVSLGLAVAAFLGVGHDESGVGRFAAHGLSPLFRGRRNWCLDATRDGAVPCARMGRRPVGYRPACRERSD